MEFYDELDLDKLEAELNSGITEFGVANTSNETERSLREENTVTETDKTISQQEYNKTIEKTKRNSGKNDNSVMTLYDWVQCVVYALVAGVLIFIFVGRAINIEGASMFPTLHNGDKVIVSDLFYTPKMGDVVVLRTLSYGPDPLVKRIIATEGQTVDIDFEAGLVYVDGIALTENYVNAPIYFRDSFAGPVKVPEGCIFVLGDNRNESSDSRHESIGMVDERCIIGKVVCILLPAYEMSGERDWSRIGEVA